MTFARAATTSTAAPERGRTTSRCPRTTTRRRRSSASSSATRTRGCTTKRPTSIRRRPTPRPRPWPCLRRTPKRPRPLRPRTSKNCALAFTAPLILHKHSIAYSLGIRRGPLHHKLIHDLPQDLGRERERTDARKRLDIHKAGRGQGKELGQTGDIPAAYTRQALQARTSQGHSSAPHRRSAAA